jgi:hypothetical protein
MSVHEWMADPINQGISRTFGDFKANWSFGFALKDRSALLYSSCSENVRYLQSNKITSAQFAIDSQIEKC